MILYRGQSWSKTYTVTDRVTGLPSDLSAAVIEFQVKAKTGDPDPPLISLFVGWGIALLPQTGATLGKFKVTLTAGDTASLAEGKYHYDLVLAVGADRYFLVEPTLLEVRGVVNGYPDAPTGVILPGPAIYYDLMPGATAAQINALMVERSYPLSPPIRLGPGLYELDAPLVGRSHVCLEGPANGSVEFRAAFAPDVSLSDDPNNALISADGTLGSLNTTTTVRSKRGTTTLTLAAVNGEVVPGAWLVVTSVNGSDEYAMSDGANDGSWAVELVKVDSVLGLVVTVSGTLQKHHCSGSTVRSTVPVSHFELRNVRLNCAGGTVAVGLSARRTIRPLAENVTVKGFSRTGIEFGASIGPRALAIHSEGEVNGIVRLDGADGALVTGVSCDPTGARFHANGIPRGLIFICNDCEAPKVGACDLQRGCIALWDRKSHNALVEGIKIRDCVPDEAATRMGVTGEYAGRIGVAMTSSAVLAYSSNVVAPTWRDIKIAECSSALTANLASAFFWHDVRYGLLDGISAQNAGGVAASGTLFGMQMQDCSGEARNLSVRGYGRGLWLSGSFVPDIDGYSFEAGTGSGSEANTEWSLFIGLTNAPRLRNIDLGGFLFVGKESTALMPKNFEIVTLEAGNALVAKRLTVAINACSGGAGNQGCNQFEVVQLDKAGAEVVAGYAQFTDSAAAAGEVLAVVLGGGKEAALAAQGGTAMSVAVMTSGQQATTMVRAADTVRPGDKLVVDNTVIGGTKGKYLMVNNAPAAGVPYVVAMQRKTQVAAPQEILVAAP